MRTLLVTAATALLAVSVQADPGQGGQGSKGKPAGEQTKGSAHQGEGPRQAKSNPGKPQDRGPAERGSGPSAKAPNKPNGNPAKPSPHDDRSDKGLRVDNDGRGGARYDDNRGDNRGSPRIFDRRDFGRLVGGDDHRGFIGGCPPGLAKKHNGCMPPGHAKQAAWYNPTWYGSVWGGDYRYRYYDGYLLRLGAGDSVMGYVPLLGGALGIGRLWPSGYSAAPLPRYYTSYYDLGPDDGYRYYDGAIYRVDPETDAITSIAALLTGDDIAVGRAMPPGYEVYNVPYDYRSRYTDGPDGYYRYSDGYVYRMDPETRLVTAVIELLTLGAV